MEAICSQFFNGADTLERKITCFSWDKVLASKKNGSLGVSNFHALNQALLLKWVWRFISQDGSLWYRVIQALPKVLTLLLIVKSEWVMVTVLGSVGSPSLEVSFRRLVRDGVERQQLLDLNSLIGSLILSSSKDRWICDLNGDGEFRVKDVRIKLDDILLPYSLLKFCVFT
ncbi:hypothetical protein CTI12_AA075670 [Artemisia annua]|uniref:RNA-directed DNA polymerase, eukaryota, Reverse transcriptase zinc-binding domain protein n=1 Tax=Artemisia annua TaxID=35608 RepID=A0A2U1Q4J4_ARTAN|nr:hypothetical protein CTI12_AA075670 [Artemisia annua]